MKFLPDKFLPPVSNIVMVIISSLLFLILLSSCNPESDYLSEISDFHFCSSDDGICDDEESIDTFDATEWDSIVACGILEVEGASSVPLRPHWLDSTGAVIATGPA